MRRLVRGALGATAAALALPAATAPKIVQEVGPAKVVKAAAVSCPGQLPVPGPPQEFFPPGFPAPAVPRFAAALPPGFYNYAITAYNAKGETTPGPERSTDFAPSASGVVELTWDPVPGAGGYRVYGRTPGNAPGSKGLLKDVGLALFYSDTGTDQPTTTPPTVDTTHNPCADLSLAGGVEPQVVKVHEMFTLTLHVTNNGPDTTAVSLHDDVPLEADFVSATPSDFCEAGVFGHVDCGIPALPRGAALVVTIQMRARQAGTALNQAGVAPAPPGTAIVDPNPGDNSASTNITIIDPKQSGTTLTVNSSVDPGVDGVCTLAECTLREAINAANTSSGSTIAFDLPAESTTIVPTDDLPPVTKSMVIDATSQPGFSGTPLVMLDGSKVVPGDGVLGRGFQLEGGGITVRGFAIVGWAGAGVFVADKDGSTVAGNFVGLTPNGERARNQIGVEIADDSNGNTIGGVDEADRNVISGNDYGIRIGAIGSQSSRDNTVAGNWIGLGPDGSTPLGNYFGGIDLLGSDNTIGGTDPSARNYISGNGPYGGGIAIEGENNVIDGNTIGLAASGDRAAGNVGVGIMVSGAALTTISANTISGNSGDGIVVWRTQGDGQGTVIDGNLVGTDSTGSEAIANHGIGIEVDLAAFTTIKGNTVSGNSADGIYVVQQEEGAVFSNNRTIIRDNRVGTDSTGTKPLGNGGIGVWVEDAGLTTVADNTISGNADYGIMADDTDSGSRSTITGNKIGTNSAGDAPIANGRDGIALFFTAATTIGGTAAGAGNVISGNKGLGVRLDDTDGADVAGNAIGTNSEGTVAVPNSAGGVAVSGANNTIGGSTGGEGNVISANGGDGVLFENPSSDGGVEFAAAAAAPDANVVEGNFIGTDADASLQLGNDGAGVRVDSFQEGVVRSNTIRHNGGAGVAVPVSGLHTLVTANSIDLNDGLGIDLGADGVTPNDLEDGDGFQDFPTIGRVVTREDATTISGSLSGSPNAGLDVELFWVPTCDPTGFGEGDEFLGTTTTKTDGSFAASVRPLPSGFVTATAIGPQGDTSEFSRCVENPIANLALDKSVLTPRGTVDQDLAYTITVVNNGASAATGVVVDDPLPGSLGLVAASTTHGSCTGTVTCELGTLAAGEKASIAVATKLLAPGQVCNTATVASRDVPDPDGLVPAVFDPDRSNNQDDACVDVTNADLSIAKTGAPNPVTVGGDLTYTLVVGNNGATEAEQVKVVDPLPASVTPLAATPSQGSCAVAATVTCDLGTVAVGSTVTITIGVRPTVAGSITNVATVASPTNDPRPGNNQATVTTLVTSADLSIAKTAAPTVVTVGQELTYTIVVANGGATEANAVRVTDPLPTSVSLVSAAPSQGACTPAGAVTCELGTLPPGASATVRIVVKPTAAGPLTNTAAVTSPTFDPNPGNNTASIDVLVTSADLSVTKTAAPDPVTVGDPLTYTLVVANAGPTRADAVELIDLLPAAVTLVTASSSRGACTSGPTLACDFGTLDNGATATVTVVVAPTEGGTIANTASVSAITYDPAAGNNSASVETPVTAADLSITKTAGKDLVTVGEELTYTIRVRNDGPTDSRGARVQDRVPEDAKLVRATSTQGGCDGEVTVSCNLGPIAARAEAAVTLVVEPTRAGLLRNTASVSGRDFDPDTRNNTATTAVDVTSADLSVTGSAASEVTVGTPLTYTLTVRNDGPTRARDVRLVDDRPAGTALVSAGSSAGTCRAQSQIVCDVGSLGDGAEAQVAVVVRPEAGGTLTNTATVSSNEYDADPSDNSVRTSATVVFKPSLVLAPPIGPPGFVTIASGSGFPASTLVLLTWSPGLGSQVVTTTTAGTFRAPVLVFQHDVLGPRRLDTSPVQRGPATAFAPVDAPFLVVTPTVQAPDFVVRR
jgi:uncharacterized repeat protein (TIGR01451 family)/CSLREA domain-containing protein